MFRLSINKLNNLKATGMFLVAFFVFSNSYNVSAQSNLSRFFKLSCPEKRWVFFHPFIAAGSFTISREASEKAIELKSDTSLDGDLNGGQLDAFRHAYWMALVTQKYGWRKAYTLGKAHEKGNYKDYKKHRTEDGTFPDEQSCQMDFLNNDAGIQTGKDNPMATSEEITKKIKDQIINGKLFIIKKDKNGRFLKCNGEIILPEELKGKWKTPKCIVESNIKK